MSAIAPEATAVVQINRSFKAPIRTVWRAFTEAEHLARWGVGQSYDNLSLDIDPREGGVIHHRVRAKQTGRLWTFHGVYYTVLPRRRLVYSFDWKDDWREPPTPSRVDIGFTDHGDHTDIAITHSELFEPAVASTDTHWNEFLDTLDEMLEGREFS